MGDQISFPSALSDSAKLPEVIQWVKGFVRAASDASSRNLIQDVNASGAALSSLKNAMANQFPYFTGPTSVALASTTAINALLAPYANPVTYGADPTGAADSTAALNAALAVSNHIYFPPGRFKLLSQISYTLPTGTNSITIEGSGQDVTTLFWPNAAGGLQFNLSSQAHSVHVRDLTLTTAQVGGGTAIGLTNSVGLIPFVIAGTQTTIERVQIVGDDRTGLTNYWTIGINNSQVSNVNVDSLTVYGNSAGTGGTGIAIDGGTAFQIGTNIKRSNFFSVGTGISIGTKVQGVTVTESNFVNGTTGINVLAGGSTLEQLYVGGSQFNVLGDQIITSTAMPQSLFVGNLFFVPSGKSGINFAQNQGCTIVGNIFQGSSGIVGTGVTVGTSVTGGIGVINDNVFVNLVTGVALQAGSNGIQVDGNNLRQSVTTPISNSGTNNVIVNNSGYNPIGPAGITVGASPCTYTAGASPETVYIWAGTVSAVTFDKNGGGLTVVASNQSPCTVELGPYEQTKVTYTAAPNMNKMIH